MTTDQMHRYREFAHNLRIVGQNLELHARTGLLQFASAHRSIIGPRFGYHPHSHAGTLTSRADRSAGMKDALMDEPLLTPSEIESYLTDLKALQEGKIKGFVGTDFWQRVTAEMVRRQANAQIGCSEFSEKRDVDFGDFNGTFGCGYSPATRVPNMGSV